MFIYFIQFVSIIVYIIVLMFKINKIARVKCKVFTFFYLLIKLTGTKSVIFFRIILLINIIYRYVKFISWY